MEKVAVKRSGSPGSRVGSRDYLELGNRPALGQPMPLIQESMWDPDMLVTARGTVEAGLVKGSIRAWR